MSIRIKYLVVTLAIVLGSCFSARAQYDKDVFYYRGRQALADGKLTMAIDNFNILTQIDTSNHLAFFFRGIAKYNLGDLRGAWTDFDTSVRINPVFTSGYHYRAIALSRFGKYDEALTDLERAIELRPGLIGLYYSRGVTYFLSQQFDKAVADFNKYIRKEPKDPSAYLNRGASYLYLADTLKAMNDYNKAIKLDRFDAEGYVRRGRLFAAQGNADEAIADMNKAIELDTTNTFAYFNRAIMYYEKNDYINAMDDLNAVLRHDPGNALTLYNRGLIYAHVGEYDNALSDLDRVININPGNVLAYFNRASVFISMERYRDALEDYDKAIELYPDFAKAYMNRSFVKHELGMMKSSREDYYTAQRKVREYRAKNASGDASLADTTGKFNSLLALDAEFAKKDFNDELIQHRDIDIRLKPLYRYVIDPAKDNVNYALSNKYEHPLVDSFEKSMPVPVSMTNEEHSLTAEQTAEAERVVYSETERSLNFLKALLESSSRQFNSSLSYLDKSVDEAHQAKGVENYYEVFYLVNRAVLRADMIEFIASMENNVQVLTMDDSRNTRARLKEQVSQQYDYSEAVEDMEAAAEKVGDISYIHFNLGNLYCLSGEHIRSIESYSKAIGLDRNMGDAYYNRGLVLIYLKDKEKGCIDLSRAGELGVKDAYPVISKYCEEARK